MKLAGLAFMLLVAIPAHGIAQDAVPSRPVSIIVPYAPGGAADIVARPLAHGLERELKQSFVVVNRPGASGAIGTQLCANARPDGHTLCAVVVQVSILPEVDALFGRKPAYTRDQLVGIARLTAEPVVFMVGTQTPWNTLQEVLDAARRKPNSIKYSTGGNYAGNHLPVAMLTQAAGVEILAVPYKGGGPSMMAALGGEVSMTSQVPGVAYPHVSAGKMRAIAHSGVKPLTDFPEVKSLKELGYDVEFYLWAGFFGPRGMPGNVMRTLRGATTAVMNSEEMRSAAAKIKIELAFQDADEFTKWWDADAARLIQTVRRMGKIE
ncbi:MAG: tripartite tricarboxylate transporter substrate binding protein [Acidobacteria bacterium]|nr:tripartite tricarboxylate transporter substrate binding protein [Acidobacteriota bacterium]